jgi:Tol biopolymer transport system component
VDAARFAPDGQTVVYSARWNGRPSEVFSQRLGSADARPFGLEDATITAIAGAEMAVVLGDGTLARGARGGGPPREVLESVVWADWKRDGSRFLVVRDVNGRQRLEFPIGKILFETSSSIEYITMPRLSPEGDQIAFINEMHSASGETSEIVLLDSSGKKRVLSKGWSIADSIAWSSDGIEIWFSANKVGKIPALHAVSLSGDERLVTRAANRMTLQDISRDGRILLINGRRRWELRGRMAGDAVERDFSWLDGTAGAWLSSDGKRMVFEESGEGGGIRNSTYFWRSDISTTVRIGDGAPFDVSPDWKWVLCGVGSPIDLSLLPIGSGAMRILPRGSIREYYWASWHPDGKRIVIRGTESGRPLRLFVQELPEGKPRPFSPEGVDGYGWAFTADGRFFTARPPGRKAPYVLYPIEGGEPRPIPGIYIDDEPIPRSQSEDGQSLFVFGRELGVPARITRLNLQTGRRESWLELTPPDRAGVSHIPFVAITPNGNNYAYSYPRTLSDLFLVKDLR